MTKRQGKSGTIDVKALLAADEEFQRALVPTALQEVLEAGARSGDDGGPWAPKRANGRRAGWVIDRAILRPDVDYADRQAGATGTARSDRAVLDRAV